MVLVGAWPRVLVLLHCFLALAEFESLLGLLVPLGEGGEFVGIRGRQIAPVGELLAF